MPLFFLFWTGVSDPTSFIINGKNNSDGFNHLKVGDSLGLTFRYSLIRGFYYDLKEYARSPRALEYESEFFIYKEDSPNDFIEGRSLFYSEKRNSYWELYKLLKELAIEEHNRSKILRFLTPPFIAEVIVDPDNSFGELLNVKEIYKVRNLIIGTNSNSDEFKDLFIQSMFSNKKSMVLSELSAGWGNVFQSFNQSRQNYLEGFSIEKLKKTSEELYLDLADKSQTIISRFGSQVLAFPVAYALLIRFYDFERLDLTRNVSLLVLTIIYFILIEVVLIQATFQGINHLEKDVLRQKGQVAEMNAPLLKEKLDQILKSIIPKNRLKAIVVRFINITLMILSLIVFISLLLKGKVELILPLIIEGQL